MSDNSILDEIHAIRAKLSDQFSGDIDAIGRHLRERQSLRGGPTVTRPPKPARKLVVNKRSDADRSGGTNVKPLDRSAAQ
jgi:hypothetical protein